MFNKDIMKNNNLFKIINLTLIKNLMHLTVKISNFKLKMKQIPIDNYSMEAVTTITIDHILTSGAMVMIIITIIRIMILAPVAQQ